MNESPNVGDDDRAILPLRCPVRIAVQVEELLEAENAALRHQLVILRRKVRGRVRLTDGDRLFFIQLYRWFPTILKAITIVRPETLVRFRHRHRNAAAKARQLRAGAP